MLNFVDTLFIYLSLSIVLCALLINLSEDYLPTIIVQTFRYGKHAYDGIPNKMVTQCEIPKAYFKHFYVFAAVWSCVMFALATLVYVAEWPIAGWLLAALDALCGTERQARGNTCPIQFRFNAVRAHISSPFLIPICFRPVVAHTGSIYPTPHAASPMAVYVAVVLLTLQCGKRFYETHYVQVFSKQSKMNLAHYIVGYLHYFGAFLAIIGHAPGFVRDRHVSQRLALDQLHAVHWTAIGLFVYALIQQHRSNLILANLRKNPAGKRSGEMWRG